LTPFILGGGNIFISNPFSMIVSVLDVPREGVQILLGHQKQQSPPFGACPKCLSVWSQNGLPYHISHLRLN